MKMKLLAAAVAVGLAGQVNAAIDDPILGFNNIGGSELLLTVYDGGDVSYTRDLGIGWNEIAGFSGSIGPDAALTDVIANASNPLVWSLTALDFGQQADSATDPSVYGRALVATTGVMNPSVTNLQNFGVGLGNVNSWITALNSSVEHASAENGVSVADSSSPTSWGRVNTSTPFSVIGALGESLTLYRFMETVEITGLNPFTGSATYAVNGVDVSQFGTWNLATDGTLSVAPVPVPAAVWLMASALAGVITLRRRTAA